MTDRVAVIGAGQMGNGIAHVFAQSGIPVTMIDVSDDALRRGRATIEKNMDRQVKKNTLSADDRQAALGRIAISTDLAAAADATLVVEAATEHTDLKFRIFSDLDRIAPPGAILASNTSSIPITRLAAVTSRPERVVGMHFMNPVPLMPLVEIVRGRATSDATCALTEDLARRLGKTPVEVLDSPGFVSNRILMPMINEAVFTLMEGVATREAIDTVMVLGMKHPMGPLALADLIGLDTCLSIMEVLHQGFGDPKYRPCPLLKRMVAAGQLGRKSGKGFHAY